MAELLRTVQAGTLVRGDIVRLGQRMHLVTNALPVICPVRPAVELRMRSVDGKSVTHVTVDAAAAVAVLVEAKS